ncbi:major facilitator superfamily transporter [Nitzschia inconspicua]|uniref:Major facilitator superfamily transporter n=1 Tax=Nitzschia inconspicua TaxID=303405 RepID=A0A9K3KDW5_9STRA|nr:major facilitator superfamily transporter [Nitzschia inconspicua]
MSSLSQDEVVARESLQEPLLNRSETSIHGNNNNNYESADEGTTPPATAIDKDVNLPSCCRFSSSSSTNTTIKINYNVFLNLLLAVMYGISNSIWNGTAYAAYLKKLGHGSNGPLGDIEAVSGLTSLLAALPMGYVADKIGRAKVIRAGGLAMLLTIVAQIGVLEWVGTDEDDNGHPQNETYNRKLALWMMGVIMAFWGIGDGVVNGPCNALFADSTPEGQRTKYFNYLFVCYTAASACGPLVSIVLFQTLGDVWDLYHLRIVMYVGLGLEIFNSLLMTLFDDRKALDESTENDDDDSDVSENESMATEGDNGECNNCPNLMTPDGNPQSGVVIPTPVPSQDLETSDATSTGSLSKRQKWIPYIVFFQGLIFAVGSGMTIKFFPLFFKDEVGMTPSQVQIIYCIVPLVMAVSSTLCTHLAGTGFGRVQAMLLYSVGGVALLYLMVFFKSYLDHHPFLLVPIYVLRTSLMNGSYPVQESILMDFVPKQERARWKSLDSVASFGWCGSAAFGGWLADKYDYTATFLITAILQTIGIAVWCLLWPLVPRTEGLHTIEQNEVEHDNDAANHEINANACLANGFSSTAAEEVAEMESLLGVTNDPNGE